MPRSDYSCPTTRAAGLLGLLLATGCISAPATVQAQQAAGKPVADKTSAAPAARAADETGKWAFAPGPDPFRDDALLDLRFLNEATAGESGFVTVDKRGDFLLGSGKPVRFWAVNTNVGREKPFAPRPQGRKTEPDLDRHARFLAKRGVNLVRLHAHVNPSEKQPATAINEAERDWIWRTVAAMKKQGIYTAISPYWAVTTKIGPEWGVAGNPSDSHGLLFFDEKLQAAYRGWLRALLAEKNPYTGVPLAQDPAVALIQLQNEDSLLFWTVNNIKGEQKRALGKKFGDFLVKKYGTLDAAFAAWKNNRLPGDDRAAGVVDFHNVWEMTQQRTGGDAARLADQLEFWARTMYDFNRDTAEFLRKELGSKHLVNAGNWRTADTVRLNDAERWSYTANDVLAVNRYFGGIHEGPNRGWAIVNGDTFTSPSALTTPLEFPLNVKQAVGKPMLVTESSWVMPNGRGAEAPFLISVYQSLTGVDGYFWFATGDDEWTPPQSANGYLPSQQKWMFGSPDVLGGFPAAALLYRQGYVRRGAAAVMEERALPDLWQRRHGIVTEESGFDPNRDAGSLAPSSSVKTPVSPLAFFVGPVLANYGGDPAKTRVADLSKYIDEANKTVRSITGEVTLNYGQGWCLLNAPKAQGVAAFFKNRGPFQTADVRVFSGNEFGAVTVVSLDDKPLKTSGKVLAQVTLPARPTGWQESPTTIALKEGDRPGYKVDRFGGPPWQVTRANVRLFVANPALKKATVLDAHGNAAGDVKLTRDAKGVRFKFPEDALYVVLQ